MKIFFLLLLIHLSAYAIGPQPAVCNPATQATCSPQPCWTRQWGVGVWSPQITTIPASFPVPADACLPAGGSLRNVQFPAPAINLFFFIADGRVNSATQSFTQGFNVTAPTTTVPGTIYFTYPKWVVNPAPNCTNPITNSVVLAGSTIQSYLHAQETPPTLCTPQNSFCNTDLTGWDVMPLSSMTCSNGCTTNTTDGQVKTAPPGGTIQLYSSANSPNCAANLATFTCNGGPVNSAALGTFAGPAGYSYASCAPSINGACNALTTATPTATPPPVASLCTMGNPSAVTTNPTNFTWTCNSTTGGTNASCTAQKPPSGCAPQSYTMLCGSTVCSNAAWNGSSARILNLEANGVAVNSASIIAAANATLVPQWYACENDRYSSGTASITNGDVTWSVNAVGTADDYSNPFATNAGACNITFTVSCATNPANADGICGTAQTGPPVATPPTTNLCGDGATPPVTTNPADFSWTCPGTGTGASTSCSIARDVPALCDYEAGVGGPSGCDTAYRGGFATLAQCNLHRSNYLSTNSGVCVSATPCTCSGPPPPVLGDCTIMYYTLFPIIGQVNDVDLAPGQSYTFANNIGFTYIGTSLIHVGQTFTCPAAPTCLNVATHNDVRGGSGFGGLVNLVTGQTTSFWKTFSVGPAPIGCRKAWKTLTCNADGSTTGVVDPSCGGSGCSTAVCTGCPAGTENDCG